MTWSFFRKLLQGSEGKSESCQTSKTERFAKIVKKEKPFNYFYKNLLLGCLTKFWICSWIGFQSFIFKSILMSKVADNPLGKQKRKTHSNLKIVDQKRF